jgi:hypothetical protein
MSCCGEKSDGGSNEIHILVEQTQDVADAAQSNM